MTYSDISKRAMNMSRTVFVVTMFLCFFRTLAQNPVKESWVTFTREDGSQSRDLLIVSESDHYIISKGDADILIDFKRSLVIVLTKENGEDRCLVSTFNQTLFPTTSTMLSLMQTDEINEPSDVPTKHLSFIPTSAEMNPSVLSKEAQDLCHGTTIYWIMPSEDGFYGNGMREKRSKKKLTINLGIVKFEISWGK